MSTVQLDIDTDDIFRIIFILLSVNIFYLKVNLLMLDSQNFVCVLRKLLSFQVLTKVRIIAYLKKKLYTMTFYIWSQFQSFRMQVTKRSSFSFHCTLFLNKKLVLTTNIKLETHSIYFIHFIPTSSSLLVLVDAILALMANCNLFTA